MLYATFKTQDAARECIRRYYLGENGTDHEK